MKVKIKKLNPNAVIPTYAKYGDAGLDLTATSKYYDELGNVVYGTGLAFEIPLGYVGLLFPRSSNAKYDLLNTNSVGVIDSGYRGEVMMKYKSTYNEYREGYPMDSDIVYGKNTEACLWASNSDFLKEYNIGDRIGQLMIIPYPQIELEEVEELSESERGISNYGSSGN